MNSRSRFFFDIIVNSITALLMFLQFIIAVKKSELKAIG
jgi:hypothetical protein